MPPVEWQLVLCEINTAIRVDVGRQRALRFEHFRDLRKTDPKVGKEGHTRSWPSVFKIVLGIRTCTMKNIGHGLKKPTLFQTLATCRSSLEGHAACSRPSKRDLPRHHAAMLDFRNVDGSESCREHQTSTGRRLVWLHSAQ